MILESDCIFLVEEIADAYPGRSRLTELELHLSQNCISSRVKRNSFHFVDRLAILVPIALLNKGIPQLLMIGNICPIKQSEVALKNKNL